MKKKVSLIFVLIFILFFTACGGSKSYNLDISGGYEISFEGDDGDGEAYAYFDLEEVDPEILREVNDQIQADYENKQEELYELADKMYDFFDTVEVIVEPDSGLSNGDEIKVSFQYDEELAKEAKLNITAKDEVINVPEDALRGVKVISEADIKKDFSIDIQGVYPDVTVEAGFKQNSDLFDSLNYEIDEVDYEEEIAVVNFEVNDYYDDSEYILELESDTITFPIEITARYISDFDEIPESDFSIIEEELRSKIIAFIEQEKNDGWWPDIFSGSLEKRAYDEPVLASKYIQILKPGNSKDYSISNNRLLLVYKVTTYSEGEETQYYIPAGITDLYVNNEGKFYYNLGNAERYTVISQGNEGEIFSKLVNSYIDRYNYVEGEVE